MTTHKITYSGRDINSSEEFDNAEDMNARFNTVWCMTPNRQITQCDKWMKDGNGDWVAYRG
jgi:hypothetical protein